MKNKNKIILSLVAMILLSSSFLSVAAARETDDTSSTPDDDQLISPAPDENAGLIAPAPDDNSTDGEQRYYILDNETSTDEAQAADNQDEQPNLIATNTSNPDSTLAIAAVGVISAIVIAAAIGVVHTRKSSSKQQV
jgi:hypothetical protein